MQLADTGTRTDLDAAAVAGTAEPWTEAIAAARTSVRHAVRHRRRRRLGTPPARRRRGRPELIEDDAESVLAIPLGGKSKNPWVAVAKFPGRPTPAASDMLRRMAELVMAQWTSRHRVRQLEGEVESLSVHIAATYEEISLLHRLTQNLKISKSDEDLGRIALEWLEEVLPARGLAIQLVLGATRSESLGHGSRQEPLLLVRGRCPVDHAQFTELIGTSGPGPAGAQPVVINRGINGAVRLALAAGSADDPRPAGRRREPVRLGGGVRPRRRRRVRHGRGQPAEFRGRRSWASTAATSPCTSSRPS